MRSIFSTEDKSGESRASKNWLILIGAVLGVALILFGSTAKKSEALDQPTPYSPAEDELVLYQSHLEGRVKELCESVAGVGRVTVIVTLSGGFESVYAVEEHDGYEEYVIVGSGANAEALFLTRNAPAIAGVGIVCQGGDQAAVCRELTALVSAAFRVPSNRIHVTAAKK